MVGSTAPGMGKALDGCLITLTPPFTHTFLRLSELCTCVSAILTTVSRISRRMISAFALQWMSFDSFDSGNLQRDASPLSPSNEECHAKHASR
jgi:hypothetical protein